MTLTRSPALKNLRAQAHQAALSGGTLQVWSGAMPANGGTPAGVLLASFALGNPAGEVLGGVFSLPPADVMAAADGAPTFVRLSDSGGAWMMDMSAGPPGSGALVIIAPAQIYAGGTVRLQRFRLIEP